MKKSNTDFGDRIIFEDNHLLVVNKLSGELVQGDRTDDTTLVDLSKTYIKETYNKPGNVFLGVPHRLDRPVSGLVIYTKTSKGLSRMSEIFRSKSIIKKYWAIVENEPARSSGKLENHLAKNEKQNKSYVVNGDHKNAKLAKLKYSVLQKSDHYYLLEIELETGRHHQIRAQLAHIGCVIKGDVKYGARRANKDASIHLHSRAAAFIHPVTKEKLALVAQCPQEALWKYFEENN